MNQAESRMSVLEELMDAVIEKKPHTKDLVNAFRPILVERARLVEKLELKHADALKIDALRAQEGDPLIQQITLFFADDPWQQIAQSMIPAIERAFPALQEDLAKLLGLIQQGEINLFDYFREFPANTEKTIVHWTKEKGIRSASLVFLLKSAMRVLLEKRRQGLDWKDVSWGKGYCPVCGTLPTIGTIQEKIAEQWLHCSSCGHDWKYERLHCPGCEHEGHQETDFFFVEDKEREAAFVCSACKKYLLTLNRIADINIRDLDLSAISLVHLDVLMQEKGFQPLCVSEWNIL